MIEPISPTDRELVQPLQSDSIRKRLAVEVDRREGADLAANAGATRWRQQVRNLEQVGSLERGKPGSVPVNAEGQWRERLDEFSTKATSGEGVKASSR